MLKTMNKTTKDNMITYVMIIGVFAIVQILMATGNVSKVIEGLLVPLCIYAILAVSLNLTVGILGELSLGHAGFMCVGAFSSAFFSYCVQDTITVPALRFFIALIIGAVAAGLSGFLIGIPVLRLRGDYLAIVTLAFGEIIKNVINAMFVGRDDRGFHVSLKDSASLNLGEGGEVIVNGPLGISGAPQDANFIIAVVLLLITVFIISNMINSRDGRAIMSIRDNRIASESIGINITKHKLMAFSISAALAGVAGVLYAHNLSNLTATPQRFGYNMSIMVLVFVVLGGIGNMRGSIIASVVLALLPELLRGLSDYRMLIYAIILIIMMLLNWAPKALEWRERYSAKIKDKFSKNKTHKEAE